MTELVKISAITFTIISAGFFIVGVLHLVGMWAIRWVCDKEMPDLNDEKFPAWLDRTIWMDTSYDVGYAAYIVDLFIGALAIFFSLWILWFCCIFTPARTVIIIVALIAGGMHTARWVMRTKTSIDNLKQKEE